MQGRPVCSTALVGGFYRAQKGRIFWKGKDITRLPPHKIAQLGIARTFQNIALYEGLSVVENLMASRHILMKQNMVTGAVYFGQAHREEIRHRRRVEDVIDFLEIEAIRKHTVAALPYGMRKRVDLGRALALEPEILLLDEPMAGMNREEKEDIARFMIDIFEVWKVPIFLVEHDMGVVMDICDRIEVLEFGKEIAQGNPDEIKGNPQVVAAYLGGEKW